MARDTLQTPPTVHPQDYELINGGRPLRLDELDDAYRRVHGAPLQAEPAAAGLSMKKLVESAARLRVVGDDAVRCRTPPTELPFIDELRAAVGRFLRGKQTAS